MAKDKCAQCGWPKDHHQNGFCYHYSDESEDHFYNDRKFISKKAIEGKRLSISFNGIITVDNLGVWIFDKRIKPYEEPLKG